MINKQVVNAVADALAMQDGILPMFNKPAHKLLQQLPPDERRKARRKFRKIKKSLFKKRYRKPTSEKDVCNKRHNNRSYCDDPTPKYVVRQHYVDKANKMIVTLMSVKPT